MKKIYLSIIVLVMAFKANAQSTCFTYTSTTYAGAGSPWYSVIADFNNDGKKDFAANNFTGNSFNVYIGNGVGSFTQAASSPYAVGANNFAFDAADFNNDGNKDIIVACANYFRVYMGNGAGTFTTSGNITFTGTCTGYGVIAGDWNNDGKMDVAFANGVAATAHVLIGNGAGSFSVAPGSPYTLPSTQWWVETGDFNKDGNADLIFSDYSVGNISVLLGGGTGTFTVQSPITGVPGAAQISLGDVNNDGNIDYVSCAGSASSNIYTGLGNGIGGFAAPTIMATPGVTAPWGVALGDFNLDGKLDAFVSGYTSNNSAVYYGNGSGGYTASTNSPFNIPGITQNLHPRVGDLDNDGRSDIIVPGYGTSSHGVLLNRQMNILGPTAICPGSAATLTAGTVSSYSWSTGASTSTITVTPSVTTTYSVYGFFNGCPTIGVKTVSINPTPTVNIASTSSIICVGQTATLSATGAFTYLWNTSAITAAIAVSPTTTTIYSVMGTDSLGCKDSAGYMVTVSLCTGINNLAKTNFLLQANPNPNNGDFSVRSDVAIKLEILNELGQIVQYLTLDENNNYQSNVSGLSSGVYFVIGNHDGQIVRNKIVVTK